MPTAVLPSRQPKHVRTPRISLRRRIRAILRALAAFIGEIAVTQGFRRREHFLQAAAREARERSEAIDASVGAISAADIRRIAAHGPEQPEPRR